MISRYFVHKQALPQDADRLVRGGVLADREDHGAVIAREYGLPAASIVVVRRSMRRLGGERRMPFPTRPGRATGTVTPRHQPDRCSRAFRR
jgi:hypothetical protein